MDMGIASLSVLVQSIQYCYRESYPTRGSEVKSQFGQGCYEAGSLYNEVFSEKRELS
jgi:hypothetical protein